MVPNVTMLLLNAAFGHRFKTQPRLLVSLVLVILFFIFTDVMVMINTDDWQDIFYVVTLISVVCININAAIFQGNLIPTIFFYFGLFILFAILLRVIIRKY